MTTHFGISLVFCSVPTYNLQVQSFPFRLPFLTSILGHLRLLPRSFITGLMTHHCRLYLEIFESSGAIRNNHSIQCSHLRGCAFFFSAALLPVQRRWKLIKNILAYMEPVFFFRITLPINSGTSVLLIFSRCYGTSIGSAAVMFYRKRSLIVLLKGLTSYLSLH
jgi:hypothetical protein